MATEPIERDVETLIDLQLRKLGWDDNPKSINRNVWKQQPRKNQEKTNLGGLKPDYILYNSKNEQPLIIIEAKRPNRDVYTALIQGKEYAEKINAPINAKLKAAAIGLNIFPSIPVKAKIGKKTAKIMIWPKPEASRISTVALMMVSSNSG